MLMSQAWDHKHGAEIFRETKSDRICFYDLVLCVSQHIRSLHDRLQGYQTNTLSVFIIYSVTGKSSLILMQMGGWTNFCRNPFQRDVVSRIRNMISNAYRGSWFASNNVKSVSLHVVIVLKRY
ncbi:hypothetical protein ISN45_Aa08g006670 [Arabidopsis thaliana x Arabidopsis arenosa]|uniref:Uncharacterized protein n=1 Tax=Arabidopsis thaliana x Arabidopsis arenosa TaxID=1240361 RepID=A0A8T1XER0_9BRAS|nr:hypothetical protein ISN45_Aa08g006670 [Arabidopsis thaliana x Arabidopsis arenosa]